MECFTSKVTITKYHVPKCQILAPHDRSTKLIRSPITTVNFLDQNRHPPIANPRSMCGINQPEAAAPAEGGGGPLARRQVLAGDHLAGGIPLLSGSLLVRYYLWRYAGASWPRSLIHSDGQWRRQEILRGQWCRFEFRNKICIENVLNLMAA